MVKTSADYHSRCAVVRSLGRCDHKRLTECGWAAGYCEQEALALAKAKGLDLIEVNQAGRVCRLRDGEAHQRAQRERDKQVRPLLRHKLSIEHRSADAR